MRSFRDSHMLDSCVKLCSTISVSRELEEGITRTSVSLGINSQGCPRRCLNPIDQRDSLIRHEDHGHCISKPMRR